MKWMDLKKEKAPSGVDVLVAYKYEDRNCVSLASHAGKHELEADNNDSFGDIIDYSEEDDIYYAPQGWYEVSKHHEEFGLIYMGEVRITHWMQKPKFPET
jgi:hypothetical protein